MVITVITPVTHFYGRPLPPYKWGYNSYNAYKLSGVMAPFVSFAKK